MKILKIIIFILIVINIAYGMRLLYELFFFSGLRISYYEDNSLKLETPVVWGKIEGVVIEYRENGAIKRKTIYKNNKKEGIEKRYYFYEDIQRETPYKNNVINGIEYTYHENGYIKFETLYVNNRAILNKIYDIDGRFEEELKLIQEEDIKFIR